MQSVSWLYFAIHFMHSDLFSGKIKQLTHTLQSHKFMKLIPTCKRRCNRRNKKTERQSDWNCARPGDRGYSWNKDNQDETILVKVCQDI